jgi:hypothetical protein
VNKLLPTLLMFVPLAYGSMDLSDFPFEVNPSEIIYRLVPPEGFNKLEIKLQLTGTADNEIVIINVDTGRSSYKINGSELGINFSPNLQEIRFSKIGMKETYKSIFLNMYYGVPKKIECGKNEFEYVQESVKITIFANSEPLVAHDNSYIESCKRFTETEKLLGE